MNEVLQNMEAWCSSKEVCISEAKVKMRKWNVTEVDSDKIIALLVDSGYINEERYAKAFANDKLILDKWGPQKVRQALKQKGIKETFISKAISEKNINQEAVVSELLLKKIKSFKQLTDNEIYAKLMRFGLSRGFDYSLVSKYAEQIIEKLRKVKNEESEMD
ncbi:MAG: RecX family transcriptional regulator [Prevotellaceae bacterium]|jgi:regulatory protein|nr:RecX family transcriptional regulator [Prevotellaceae bacterium]